MMSGQANAENAVGPWVATDFTLDRVLSEAELETLARHFGGQFRILGAKFLTYSALEKTMSNIHCF